MMIHSTHSIGFRSGPELSGPKAGQASSGQGGQTLLEMLVAMGVGIAVLASIVVVVIVSLSNANFSKNQNLATQYAQEGMEVVRRIRNSSWVDFSIKNGTFCLPKSQTNLSQKPIGGACSKIDNFFDREVIISWSGDRAEVLVEVSWTDSKGKHVSKLISYFTEEGGQ